MCRVTSMIQRLEAIPAPGPQNWNNGKAPSEAVSSAPGLRFGLYVLLVVYTLMTVATVYVLRRLARRPLPVAPQEHDVVEEKVT